MKINTCDAAYLFALFYHYLGIAPTTVHLRSLLKAIWPLLAFRMIAENAPEYFVFNHFRRLVAILAPEALFSLY